MTTFKTQRFVPTPCGHGYRLCTAEAVSRLVAAGRLVLEGVDGDEAHNLVNYFYRFTVAGEDF